MGWMERGEGVWSHTDGPWFCCCHSVHDAPLGLVGIPGRANGRTGGITVPFWLLCLLPSPPQSMASLTIWDLLWRALLCPGPKSHRDGVGCSSLDLERVLGSSALPQRPVHQKVPEIRRLGFDFWPP